MSRGDDDAPAACLRDRRGSRPRQPAPGARLVDLSEAVCAAAPCPVVVHDMIVFRDDHHLTATFARSLAPELAAALDRVLATAP